MKTECGSSPESITGKETIDYNPFGAEWESKILKFKKQDLVEMLRATLKNHFTKEQVEELLTQLKQILQAIPHDIPFYAYGDNEAACQMDSKLQWLWVELNAVIKKLETSLESAPSPNLEQLKEQQ